MASYSRKVWARTGASEALAEAEEAVGRALKFSGPLPAKLRRRLERLETQIADLRRAVQEWPVSRDERWRRVA